MAIFILTLRHFQVFRQKMFFQHASFPLSQCTCWRLISHKNNTLFKLWILNWNILKFNVICSSVCVIFFGFKDIGQNLKLNMTLNAKFSLIDFQWSNSGKKNQQLGCNQQMQRCFFWCENFRKFFVCKLLFRLMHTVKNDIIFDLY